MSQTSAAIKGSRTATSGNDPANAQDFIIERFLKSKVNTAILVKVDSVDPGAVGPVGTLTCTPLVAGMDGDGNAIPAQPIHNVPYLRIQGGVAALILDPMPGDLGLAVTCQRDVSSAKKSKGPANPGSFRFFDQADSLYLGGFLNDKPEIYLELTQEGVATLRAPQKIVLDSPLVEITGTLTQGTGSGQGGTSTFNGNVHTTGNQTSDGDQVAGDISQKSHVHTGIEPGPSNTGGPV